MVIGLLMMPPGAWAARNTAQQETIGSWVVSCAADGRCLMRFAKPFVDRNGITGNLEVMKQSRSLVPVVTLRGVPKDLLTAAAVAGKASVSVRFPGAPAETLNCVATNAGGICAPDDDAAPRLAARLVSAPSVTLHLTASLPGMDALPQQHRSLVLSGTAEALDRLRAAGPTSVPPPVTALAPESPAALMATADRLLKAAGYKNGVEGLQSLLDKYRGTLAPPGGVR